ncbi:MAG TPA: prepilin-type N-terminal cleavage/methylation domain-containing protein [Acidimicrobiales bacterium]|nr:prepilin-type N-terminal cleavage/methylation domain-containing protein [Acidimicrobiales bacterium]
MGEEGEDAGFTLIELMVVLLILAILLAIAIPTFLGVTKSANDRAAQSNLNTALINAKAAYQQAGQTYTTFNTATLSSAEPSLSYTTGTTNAQSLISVYTSTDGNGVLMVSWSKSNQCWAIADNPNPITNNAPGANNPVQYTNSTTAGTVPVGQGVWYGKTASPTATTATCGANTGLANMTWQQNGFSS